MTQPVPPSSSNPTPPQGTPVGGPTFLGFSTSDLAGLSVDDLVRNPTAIRMMMHYYKQLHDENESLKTNINTLNTYATGYMAKKIYGRVAAACTLFSNILIGFGVNLITGGVGLPGVVLMACGVMIGVAGLAFSFRESV
jgi:hypothetical protein